MIVPQFIFFYRGDAIQKEYLIFGLNLNKNIKIKTVSKIILCSYSFYSNHFTTCFLLILFLGVMLNQKAFAQEKEHSVEGYAIINYMRHDWETDPAKRSMIDLEKLVLEAKYELNKNISFEGEIEIEHGGSGVSMDFDRLEEFGEYEVEIGKGGELIIEQLFAEIKINDLINLKLGHFYLPVGLAFKFDNPTKKFTARLSETEANILPAVWHETGISVFGSVDKFNYELQLINGLDATGFSSATWVRRGSQKRFETVNAENMALSGRLDYYFDENNFVGVSGYFGNSADNRPKPDINVNANVSIASAHLALSQGSFKINGLFLYGTLQNSEAVSKANRNLSNNLNVKRSPVGAAAMGYFLEAGYDLQNILQLNESNFFSALWLYGRYDFYDTMHKTEGEIFDNPRWERKVITTGLNYFIDKNLVIKSQFSNRKLGTLVENTENTFTLGLGFSF